MPTSVSLSDLIGGNAFSTQGNQPYILNPYTSQPTANPAYLNPLQNQQLSTLDNGPTQGAIQGSAIQTAANKGAELAATTLGQRSVPFTPEQLQQLIDPTTGQQLPLGTTPGQVQGKQFISKDQQDQLNELKGVQNVVDQVRKASNAVNTSSSSDAGSFGNRNIGQYINGLKLRAEGDTNVDTLDHGVQGLLGLVSSGALGVNRFNEDEINKLSANIPTPFDTKEVAQSKLNRIQSIVDTKVKDLTPAKSSSPSATPFQGAGTPSQGGAMADPLGLFQ